MEAYIIKILENPMYIFLFGGGGVIVIVISIAVFFSNRKRTKNKSNKTTVINNKITNINNSNNKSNYSNNKIANSNKTNYNAKCSVNKSNIVNNIYLEKISLYSTTIGKTKTYTNIFFKSKNHNFGVEMRLKNNSSQNKSIHIGGCVYDINGNPTIKWKNIKVSFRPNGIMSQSFFVNDKKFSEMKAGKYKIQFWINDNKVQKDFFEIRM